MYTHLPPRALDAIMEFLISGTTKKISKEADQNTQVDSLSNIARELEQEHTRQIEALQQKYEERKRYHDETRNKWRAEIVHLTEQRDRLLKKKQELVRSIDQTKLESMMHYNAVQKLNQQHKARQQSSKQHQPLESSSTIGASSNNQQQKMITAERAPPQQPDAGNTAPSLSSVKIETTIKNEGAKKRQQPPEIIALDEDEAEDEDNDNSSRGKATKKPRVKQEKLINDKNRDAGSVETYGRDGTVVSLVPATTTMAKAPHNQQRQPHKRDSTAMMLLEHEPLSQDDSRDDINNNNGTTTSQQQLSLPSQVPLSVPNPDAADVADTMLSPTAAHGHETHKSQQQWPRELHEHSRAVKKERTAIDAEADADEGESEEEHEEEDENSQRQRNEEDEDDEQGDEVVDDDEDSHLLNKPLLPPKPKDTAAQSTSPQTPPAKPLMIIPEMPRSNRSPTTNSANKQQQQQRESEPNAHNNKSESIIGATDTRVEHDSPNSNQSPGMGGESSDLGSSYSPHHHHQDSESMGSMHIESLDFNSSLLQQQQQQHSSSSFAHSHSYSSSSGHGGSSHQYDSQFLQPSMDLLASNSNSSSSYAINTTATSRTRHSTTTQRTSSVSSLFNPTPRFSHSNTPSVYSLDFAASLSLRTTQQSHAASTLMLTATPSMVGSFDMLSTRLTPLQQQQQRQAQQTSRSNSTSSNNNSKRPPKENSTTTTTPPQQQQQQQHDFCIHETQDNSQQQQQQQNQHQHTQFVIPSSLPSEQTVIPPTPDDSKQR